MEVNVWIWEREEGEGDQCDMVHSETKRSTRIE